jgi:hypothetical protein
VLILDNIGAQIQTTRGSEQGAGRKAQSEKQVSRCALCSMRCAISPPQKFFITNGRFPGFKRLRRKRKNQEERSESNILIFSFSTINYQLSTINYQFSIHNSQLTFLLVPTSFFGIVFSGFFGYLAVAFGDLRAGKDVFCQFLPSSLAFFNLESPKC